MKKRVMLFVIALQQNDCCLDFILYNLDLLNSIPITMITWLNMCG